MTAFYRFLASHEALIYIVLSIGALFSLRWLWNSWWEWRRSFYQLEREFAMRRLSQSLAILGIILALSCTEFFMASFIIPGLPAQVFLSTPTLNLLTTPTGTLSPEEITQFAALPATQTPNGCIPNQIILTSPEPAEEIKGTIELIGTVDIPNFGFYKYEYAARGSDTWSSIFADRKVVRNGVLGRWDTTTLTPGDYELRLVVIDNKGQSMPACVVAVRVMAQ
jgi:hypothetical protein